MAHGEGTRPLTHPIYPQTINPSSAYAETRPLSRNPVEDFTLTQKTEAVVGLCEEVRKITRSLAERLVGGSPEPMIEKALMSTPSSLLTVAYMALLDTTSVLEQMLVHVGSTGDGPTTASVEKGYPHR